MAAALARKTAGLPVKFVFSRKEEFVSTVVRQPAVIMLKSGVSRGGGLVAREVKIIWDTGAYSDIGPVICRNAGYPAAGPYQISHVKIDSYCVYTNNPVTGPFRGFGVPQTTWALESHTDILAEKLGMDPLEFRLKNSVEEGSISATGQRLYNVKLKESLQEVAQDIGWGKRAGKRARGKGIACMHRDTASPTTSSALVKLNEDGTATVLTSGAEIGQGYSTVMAQMAAEVLGVIPEDITLAEPDTEFTPFDDGAKSSRLTFSTGNAVMMAARDARDQIYGTAAEMLEANVYDLETKEGKVFVRGFSERYLTLTQISMAHLRGKGGPILGRGSFAPRNYTPFDVQTGHSEHPTPFWMYGAHAVEVEVDEETGKVVVLRVSACHDVGKVVNPMTCEGQIEGSLVMGLGTSLWERITLDAGKVLNPNLADYKLCTALDVPSISCSFVDSSHPDGPFGAKGVGEAAIVPSSPAIANAIYDAVAIRVKDLPLTQERLFNALKLKKTSVGEGE
jgi:carbon-monoxide dehydrogenase large subunit